MVAAVALEVEDAVDHVLQHPRAGDLAVLRHVADEDDGGAGLLGVADQRLGGGAHLGDGAGRQLHAVGPQRLDRVDDHEPRRRFGAERRQDVLDAGLGREPDRRLAERQALRAQADLGDRLLARDVDDRMPRCRERAGDLEEKRRLADPRIAADQKRRARAPGRRR